MEFFLIIFLQLDVFHAGSNSKNKPLLVLEYWKTLVDFLLGLAVVTE